VKRVEEKAEYAAFCKSYYKEKVEEKIQKVAQVQLHKA
jgi:hypothetical protein